MAKPSFKVSVVDKGFDALKKLAKRLEDRKAYVKVGVLGEKAKEAHPDEDGKGSATNADIAVFTEYGTVRQPARPFIGMTFEKNKATYLEKLREQVGEIYEGRGNIERTLGLLGAQMARDIKETVLKGESPFAPNAPSTLRRKLAKGRGKGAPRPVVDSGRLINSVTWDVSTGEGE